MLCIKNPSLLTDLLFTVFFFLQKNIYLFLILFKFLFGVYGHHVSDPSQQALKISFFRCSTSDICNFTCILQNQRNLRMELSDDLPVHLLLPDTNLLLHRAISFAYDSIHHYVLRHNSDLLKHNIACLFQLRMLFLLRSFLFRQKPILILPALILLFLSFLLPLLLFLS